MDGYVVTLRAPSGKPLEIRCAVHPACGWSLGVASARGDDDPIFRAMHGAHLQELATPDRKAGGHIRSRRR
jgi:hypothetical protein